MLHFLMAPANCVCDRLGIQDEHERGMMRMLVNLGICTLIAAPLVYAGWKAFP